MPSSCTVTIIFSAFCSPEIWITEPGEEYFIALSIRLSQIDPHGRKLQIKFICTPFPFFGKEDHTFSYLLICCHRLMPCDKSLIFQTGPSAAYFHIILKSSVPRYKSERGIPFVPPLTGRPPTAVPQTPAWRKPEF